MSSATRFCRAASIVSTILLLASATNARGAGRKRHAGEQETVLIGPKGTVGIGCDSCAVSLQIRVEVTDTEGVPVEGAEVWMVDRAPPYPRENDASRLGVTGKDGTLIVPGCLMSSDSYRFWQPKEGDTVTFLLMVIHDGFGVGRIELTPAVDEVLAKGNLTGAAPGTDRKHWKYLKEWRGHDYPVHGRIQLKRTIP